MQFDFDPANIYSGRGRVLSNGCSRRWNTCCCCECDGTSMLGSCWLPEGRADFWKKIKGFHAPAPTDFPYSFISVQFQPWWLGFWLHRLLWESYSTMLSWQADAEGACASQWQDGKQDMTSQTSPLLKGSQLPPKEQCSLNAEQESPEQSSHVAASHCPQVLTVPGCRYT